MQFCPTTAPLRICALAQTFDPAPTVALDSTSAVPWMYGSGSNCSVVMDLVPYRPVADRSQNAANRAARIPGVSPTNIDLAAPQRLAVTFMMEQHLGHRTYYENLRAHVDPMR